MSSPGRSSSLPTRTFSRCSTTSLGCLLFFFRPPQLFVTTGPRTVTGVHYEWIFHSPEGSKTPRVQPGNRSPLPSCVSSPLDRTTPYDTPVTEVPHLCSVTPPWTCVSLHQGLDTPEGALSVCHSPSVPVGVRLPGPTIRVPVVSVPTRGTFHPRLLSGHRPERSDSPRWVSYVQGSGVVHWVPRVPDTPPLRCLRG